jgi:hypothetical protein
MQLKIPCRHVCVNPHTPLPVLAKCSAPVVLAVLAADTVTRLHCGDGAFTSTSFCSRNSGACCWKSMPALSTRSELGNLFVSLSSQLDTAALGCRQLMQLNLAPLTCWY